MKNVEFVMIGLENPFWNSQCTNFVANNFDFINESKCMEAGFTRYFESDPHITIGAKLLNAVGPNTVYCYLKITNRDLYNELKSNSVIHLDSPIIDRFDNDDGSVIKINLDRCDQFKLLKEFNDLLVDKFLTSTEYKEFHPHITLTYLKSGVDEDTYNRMIDGIDLSKLSDFNMSSLIMSDEQKEQKIFYFNR